MQNLKLQRGDKVGLVASSNPILPELGVSLQKAYDFFESIGLNPVLGEHLKRSDHSGKLVDPKLRASDFNSFIEDEKIKAIINLWGGYSSHEIVELVDWNKFVERNLLLIGASDFTYLLNAVSYQYNAITYHWANAIWLGLERYSYCKESFKRFFLDKEDSVLSQFQVINEGIAQGVVQGGNLETFERMIGTNHFDMMDGTILLIEDVDKCVNQVKAMIDHLQYAQILEKCSAIIIGNFDSSKAEETDINNQIVEYVARISSLSNKPIIKTSRIGHNVGNTVVPIGGHLMLDTGHLLCKHIP